MDDHLRQIEDSGEHLLSILNNMLDMARMESGEVALDEEEYFIDPKLPLADRYTEAARRKGIRLTKGVAVEHHSVILDRAKVEQICANLIENAIKYTPESGSVRVEVEELPCAQAEYASYRTTVSDDGIGISAAFQAQLFESFSRERTPPRAGSSAPAWVWRSSGGSWT